MGRSGSLQASVPASVFILLSVFCVSLSCTTALVVAVTHHDVSSPTIADVSRHSPASVIVQIGFSVGATLSLVNVLVTYAAIKDSYRCAKLSVVFGMCAAVTSCLMTHIVDGYSHIGELCKPLYHNTHL